MNSTATYADLAELVSTIKKPESSSSDLSRFPEDEEEMFDFEEEDEQLEEDAQQFSDGRDDGQWFVMVWWWLSASRLHKTEKQWVSFF